MRDEPRKFQSRWTPLNLSWCSQKNASGCEIRQTSLEMVFQFFDPVIMLN